MSKFVTGAPVFLVDHRNRESVGFVSSVTNARIFVTFFVNSFEVSREFRKDENGRYINKQWNMEVFSSKRALNNR